MQYTEEQVAKFRESISPPSVQNSWDDSVEFTPNEMPKIDRFTFNYEDEYGMNISHGFNPVEFEYNLLDVVANFVLYLKGIGYDDEQIGEYIKMGSL